jgi:hypothetical protein
MNIAQLSEQLKDVPDGALAQYVRDPKSQVPQYLALGELQRRKRIRDMGGVSPDAAQSKTLVDDILESGDVREAGLPGLPAANQMYDEQSFAGGGIIAFADGGDIDDEEGMYTQEDLDEMEMDSEMEAMLKKGMARRGSIDGGIATLPAAGINPEAKSSRGVESLQEYVMRKESGGRRYDKNGNLLTSSKGAEGEMQVMPMTQRDPGFGVRPAQDNSPDEKARVGRDYLSALYSRYGDPKLAAIAYNWGPGNTDKWLAAGADMDKLPRETRNYIAQLAGGGEVKHFVEGGNTMEGFDDMFNQREEQVKYDPYFVDGLFSGYTSIGPASKVDPKSIIRKPSTSKKSSLPKKDEAGFQEIVDRAMIEPMTPSASAGVPAVEAPKEMTPYEKYFARLEERRGALAKGAEDDKNLALLAAGLGMLGGKSQNALENIGAGGAQGIAQYTAAKRARAAEELALDKAEFRLLISI